MLKNMIFMGSLLDSWNVKLPSVFFQKGKIASIFESLRENHESKTGSFKNTARECYFKSPD